MLFTKTDDNLDKIISMIMNINDLCNIQSEKIEGTKTESEIEINYEIKLKYEIILTKKYPTMSNNEFETFFSEFLDEGDNSIYINLYDVYRCLIGEKKDNYITEWIKNYFCYDNDFLKRFKELHNEEEV